MPRTLPPGLYEALITAGLDSDLGELATAGWTVDQASADPSLRAELLARHVYELARRALEAVRSGDEDTLGAHQLALANRLIAVLRDGEASHAAALAEDAVAEGVRVLRELRCLVAPLAQSGPTPRPTLSLRHSGLLVNAGRDYQLGGELAKEIESADRIELLCAFVRFSGVRLVREALARFAQRGGVLRVLTSIYTGSTERRALDVLAELGASIKVSFETEQTRLHAKAWLFHRNSGFSTGFVGSSNLTRAALLDGLEWNVRLAEIDNGPILQRFSATFEQYWAEAEFVSYDPSTGAERLDRALAAQRSRGDGGDERRLQELLALALEVEPRPVQIPMLEALEAERARGHHRNLVVAATGTGKTWVAGFDYRRLRAQGVCSLLFVAHRDEILRQSQLVFQLILRDADFGERLVAGERPRQGQHVFASIQSLERIAGELPADAFDMVIVDEFHHAAAPTYARLLERLRPRILLGLTATPERTDGKPILQWFDNRIACEHRLWDALDQGALCPFHYFGVHDGTDLSSLTFQRGRYAPAELENLYTGDHQRVKRVLQAVSHYVGEPTRMRALGFCVGVEHARFMARQFTDAGLHSVALDGTTPPDERRAAVQRLRRGELRVIFTVDLFNEGVDIPEVDTLLMLRPTESATIFLQQLGRGLRRIEGKSVLTVLDFIGHAHKQFRFDVRFRALVGGTRRQVAQAIEADFPLLPGGCAIQLDRVAQELVLRNVRDAVRQTRSRLLEDLRALGPTTTLAAFLQETAIDVEELYQRPAAGHSFTELRRAARFEQRPVSAQEETLKKALGRLLHVNDPERLDTWRRWLAAGHPPDVAALGPREQRLAHMLHAALGQRLRPVAELPEALQELWSTTPILEELRALLGTLDDRARAVATDLGLAPDLPLGSHAAYSLYELVAAAGLIGPKGTLRETREGVLRVPACKAEFLFVTLDKSEADYAQNTRYNDYPISPTLFHWETQNTVTADGEVARRYIEHEARGLRIVLFVRERKKDARGETAAYLCLGQVRHVQHEGERPMRIVWKLDRAMPGSLFQAAKVAAG